MRQAHTGCLLLIALLMALVSPQATASKPKTLRVLFVGNSLTYYNDLPATFATLYRAAEPGVRVETEMLAQGGGKLRERLAEGRLAALLTQQHYDFVVLQELGGWPACPREFPGCEDAPTALRESVNLVRANGARPVWLSTWQPTADAQRSLSALSMQLARELDLDTVDAGAALQRLPAPLRKQALDRTGHPAPTGTWLMAAGLVRAIATQPLPDRTPPRSCGRNWRGALKASAPASAQRHGKAECHVLANTQWRALKAAVQP